MKFFKQLFIIYLTYQWSMALQCMDENNNPVDWYVMYKLPAMKNKGSYVEEGVGYTYMTSSDHSKWIMSKNSIENSNSMLGNTLDSLYKYKRDLLYILYNDELPTSRKSEQKGHTKGIVAANSTGGFWLVHSVPKFPDLTGSSYTYPSTGKIYGQSCLCISMDLINLNKVGLQLQYNQPEIYEENIPSSLKLFVPELVVAANNVTVKKSPWFNVIDIKSKAGINFTSFAKADNFNKDLYEDLLSIWLKVNFLVETWPNGSGRLHSNCSQQYKVNNIDAITIDAANVSFKSTHDHSKWAVSETLNEQTWICIGDINRADHQKKRGGGTVCLNNKQLVKNYQKTVISIEHC